MSQNTIFPSQGYNYLEFLLNLEGFFAGDIILINLIWNAHKFWEHIIEPYGFLEMKNSNEN